MAISCTFMVAAFVLLLVTMPFLSAKEEDVSAMHTIDDWTNGFALSEVVIQPRGNVETLHRLARRDGPVTSLANNAPTFMSISPGQIQNFIFPSSELEKPLSTVGPTVPLWRSASQSSKSISHQELRRQSQNSIFVTLNVCNQPSPLGTKPSGPPPPLTIWISLNNDNKMPGPKYQGIQQTSGKPTIGGRTYYEDLNKVGDTYIGVSAPDNIDGFSGQWNYQLAVSNQNYFTDRFQHTSLRVLDSDLNSTFLVTDSLIDPSQNDTTLADQWQATGGVFGIFMYDAADPLMQGVNDSFCGLANYALAKGTLQSLNTSWSETSMRKYNGTLPYQQFWIGQLNSSTSYRASLALVGNYSKNMNTSTVAGGGSIWQSIDVATRSADTNCQLVYNLTFCDDVAYSVPTNSSFYDNATKLAAQYDDYTRESLWPKFQNSLDQIPCNTSADAKYSLARSCTDCARAYKNWVCAVSIPRCADFGSSASFLQARNTKQPGEWRNMSIPDIEHNPILMNETNAQSRNMNLSNWVNMTGPYKEVLPCDNLCFELVQSCPSILGFACPWRGRGLEWSYGSIPPGQDLSILTDGYPACNMPGAIWGVSSASKALPSMSFWLLVAATTFLLRP